MNIRITPEARKNATKALAQRIVQVTCKHQHTRTPQKYRQHHTGCHERQRAAVGTHMHSSADLHNLPSTHGKPSGQMALGTARGTCRRSAAMVNRQCMQNTRLHSQSKQAAHAHNCASTRPCLRLPLSDCARLPATRKAIAKQPPATTLANPDEGTAGST